MISELYALTGAIILGLIHLFVSVHLSTRERGVKWNLSSREANLPPLTGVAGRADRALNNFKETFPFFLGALVAVSWSDSFGTLSLWGSSLYLLGRLIYFPLYLGNITVFRSLAWLMSIAGIVMILLELFF